MILDEFRKLVREQYEYAMTNVHICLPGKVVKYNAKTRRAEIQPCFKRKMPDGSYVNFPVVVDVPVRFFGTKKYTVHLPPEENDEVAIHFIERCTDVWKDEGHDEIEDKDPRRFNLQDCYVTLGLQPQEFIDVPEEGLVIKHWTAWDGDLISHVIMDDDKIEMKYDYNVKDKCFVIMNKDKIEATYRDESYKDAGANIGHVVMNNNMIMAEYKICTEDKQVKVQMEDDKITTTTEHNTAYMTKKQIHMTNGNKGGDDTSTYDFNEGTTTLKTKNVIWDVKENISIKAGGNITHTAGGVNRDDGATVQHN